MNPLRRAHELKLDEEPDRVGELSSPDPQSTLTRSSGEGNAETDPETIFEPVLDAMGAPELEPDTVTDPEPEPEPEETEIASSLTLRLLDLREALLP